VVYQLGTMEIIGKPVVRCLLVIYVETIIDEKEYKGATIVLGKDRYQHMIGVKCQKKSCITIYHVKGFRIHWKKFFTNLPPAGEYVGALGLARAYFTDPDGKMAQEYGELSLSCDEIYLF
jgi:hypothetical protein